MRAPQKLRLKDDREIALAESIRIAANLKHDLKYGLDYGKVSWRCAYEPASRVLTDSAIWSHHRKLEVSRMI